MFRSFFCGFFSGLLTASLVGCGGGKMVPAEGHITFDGKPLAGATVRFLPEQSSNDPTGSRMASAFTKEDGSFKLHTGNDAGAAPGNYKVTVSKKIRPAEAGAPAASQRQDEDSKDEKPRRAPPGMSPMDRASKMVETMPPEYTLKDKTPLRIVVPKEGARDLKLEVTRTKP